MGGVFNNIKGSNEGRKKLNYMKEYVSFSRFCDAFSPERRDTFSYHGKKALFEYLEDYEDGTGEEVELDTVALCCEFAEYDSALDCIKDIGIDFKYLEDYEEGDENKDEDEREEIALKHLQHNTQVITFEDDILDGKVSGIIIQSF